MLPLTPKPSLMMELEQEIQTLQDDKTAVLVSRDETLSCLADSVHNESESNKKEETEQCVHFPTDFERFHPTLHVLEYTFEEKRNTWYNLDDLEQIKKERRSTIKRMNKGSKLKKGQYTRGLEAYTREGSKIRQKIIAESIAAVKIEQSNQKVQNGMNTGQIAQAYETYSLPCQLAAHELGLSDRASIDTSDDEEREGAPCDVAVGWQRS